MEDKEQRYMDYPQGQVSPGLSDSDEFFSKSLELTEWFNSGLSTTGSFDVGIMVASPFGKLLDALPVPAMMIDSSYKVAFANQACGTISDSYKIVQGVPFASLVPRQRNSEKALAVLKKVLLTRKSVVAEAILEIDARKVWGRLHFRPIRIGADRYVLLVISDITNEKTGLLLKQKSDVRKDFLISAANEKLSEQFRHRERIEIALRAQKTRFEKLAELLKLPIAILSPDGGLRYSSTDFREFFGSIVGTFSSRSKAPTEPGTGLDPHCIELLNWFTELGTSKESAHSVRTFVIKNKDGCDKTIACRVAQLENGEYMIFCEDAGRNGYPQGSRCVSPTL